MLALALGYRTDLGALFGPPATVGVPVEGVYKRSLVGPKTHDMVLFRTTARIPGP